VVPTISCCCIHARLSRWKGRRFISSPFGLTCFGKVDVRLPGKGNSYSHDARPVHLITTIIKWIRTIKIVWKGRRFISSPVGLTCVGHVLDYYQRVQKCVLVTSYMYYKTPPDRACSRCPLTPISKGRRFISSPAGLTCFGTSSEVDILVLRYKPVNVGRRPLGLWYKSDKFSPHPTSGDSADNPDSPALGLRVLRRIDMGL